MEAVERVEPVDPVGRSQTGLRREIHGTLALTKISTSDPSGCVNGAPLKVEASQVEFVGKTTAEPCVSYLRSIFPLNGVKTLHQSKVTDCGLYDSFVGFVIGFRNLGVYPTTQETKFESYGWTPTLFEEGEYKGKLGTWRRAEFATGELSLFYGDVDNNNEAFPAVSIDRIESLMKGLGVSYVLYTSFSHTPEKHKVRIVTPISRYVSYRESFKLHLFFNELLERQLDASIYDPSDYLYGPGPLAEIRVDTEGLSLDVDAVLAWVDGLDDIALAPLHQYDKKAKEPARQLTPEEVKVAVATMRDTSIRGDISLANPKVFNPEWMSELIGCANGGSHRQTLFSVLTKVYVKSEYTLTGSELRSIQLDMDAVMHLYCSRKYGKSALESDLKSVIHFRGTRPSTWKSPEEFKREKSRERWKNYRRS